MNPKQIEIVHEAVATAHLLLAAMIPHSQMENIGPARLHHDSSGWSSLLYQWVVYMFLFVCDTQVYTYYLLLIINHAT